MTTATTMRVRVALQRSEPQAAAHLAALAVGLWELGCRVSAGIAAAFGSAAGAKVSPGAEDPIALAQAVEADQPALAGELRSLVRRTAAPVQA